MHHSKITNVDWKIIEDKFEKKSLAIGKASFYRMAGV
jgi:hypothetical protein